MRHTISVLLALIALMEMRSCVGENGFDSLLGHSRQIAGNTKKQKGELSTMAFSLKKLFVDTDKLAAANAKYKARMTEIKEKEELTALNIEARKLAIDTKFKDDIVANNAEFKEAWSK